MADSSTISAATTRQPAASSSLSQVTTDAEKLAFIEEVTTNVDAVQERVLAVDRAASALLRPRGAAVADYTSRACVETAPGHYVIYWELEGSPAPPPPRTCWTGAAWRWRRPWGRCTGRAGWPTAPSGHWEIRVVRPGTFEELADYAVSRGASVGQYKVPRCVTAPAVAELLDSRVVSSHLSPALPHWTPARRFQSDSFRRGAGGVDRGSAAASFCRVLIMATTSAL
ncbi:unnamed protein product [Miscanthus lutarioriparius]|uniref:GH3 C-terminal domain-containing protein n=1 Tax=Miscanthus lutarioriparius TaxID=422564 RepID=A0A811RGL7_9POAL|nr:unnamed protein product [Miscanthus lutarioriparius]